jgi:hypothetical protein
MAQNQPFMTPKTGGTPQSVLDDTEFAAAIDRVLVEIVSVPPSAHFHATLRSRIAAEPAPVPSFWRPIVAADARLHRRVAVAVALAMMAVIFLVRIDRRHNPPGAAVAVSPLPATNAVVKMPPVPVAAESRPTRRHVRPLLPSAAGEPEVLVSKSELAAVLRFYEQAHADGPGSKGLASANVSTDDDNVVKPIVIAPLLVSRLPDLDQPEAAGDL